MLEARDVVVHAGGAELLRGVSVAVRPGEVVAVIGPNGAGKSTLLRVLSGDVAPRAGTVSMDGVALARLPILEQARRRAVLAQGAELTFGFTALQVALLGRSPHLGTTTARRDRGIARAALRRARVHHLASRSYLTLSGGERQRVMLARALAQIWEAPAHGARYLLLDEPTAALDLAQQHGALEVARAMAETGTGVLVILHDLNLAARHARRVLLIANGRAVAQGTPAEVLREAVLESVFGIGVRVVADPVDGLPLVFARAAGGDVRHGSRLARSDARNSLLE